MCLAPKSNGPEAEQSFIERQRRYFDLFQELVERSLLVRFLSAAICSP